MVVTSEAGNTKLQLTITRYTNPRTHSLNPYRLIRFQSFTVAKCASRHFCYHGTASERILQSQRDRIRSASCTETIKFCSQTLIYNFGGVSPSDKKSRPFLHDQDQDPGNTKTGLSAQKRPSPTGNDSVPKIITNNAINLFLKLQQSAFR